MKNSSIFVIIVIIFLLTASLVYAGVTNPLPPQLELLKGETGRFKFQVQNLNKPVALDCSFELEGTKNLDVTFDQSSGTINANDKSDFFGSVKAPDTIGRYTQNFCVRCSPKSQESGASVKIDSCGLPINVNVVAQKTKENMRVEDRHDNKIIYVGVIALVVIIACILWYYFRKKSHKKISKKK
jgi:hypothetical protein